MSQDRTNQRGNTPIAWHPLFPAMLAVWFGALFGLGVLAVRVALIEKLAVASGIEALVPAAAPPLGMNARIVLALGFALTGGILGAVIGTLLARSKPSAQARRAEAAAAKAVPPEPAIEARAAETGEAPSFIDISELDLGETGVLAPSFDEAPAPAAGEGDGARDEVEDIIVTAPAPPQAPASAAAAAEARPASRRAAADPTCFPLPAAFPVPGGAAAQRLAAADLDSLSHLELIERLALSLQKRREEAPVYLDGPSVEAFAGAADAGSDAAAVAPRPYPPSHYPLAPFLEANQHPLHAAADDETADDSADPLLGGEPGFEAKPVALFPEPPTASARQAPAATERALRDALAALQRMSGAA